VIPSGPTPKNPAELISSPRMAAALERLGRHFQVVVVDGPALLSVSDASAIARIVDGVVLVVGSEQPREDVVRDLRRTLDAVKAHPFGVVVNRGRPPREDAYYGAAAAATRAES